ncbi:DUF4303 domain-containing protein [Acinetobacter gerneri]|uniref:DUF4303 domain-containing protein n=1 Tax=Acinetobacter gerneri TaxID=202952 RepID=UPI003AF785B5
MDSWHKFHLNQLASLIADEFVILYKKYTTHGDHLYATALITDDDALTTYMMISTEKSKLQEHKGIEWEPNAWVQGLGDDNDTIGIRAFTPLMMKHFEEDIVPLFQQGFDYNIELNKNIKLFEEAMVKAKRDLITKLGDQINDIVFFVSIFGEPEIAINSAKLINNDSQNLRTFLQKNN